MIFFGLYKKSAHEDVCAVFTPETTKATRTKGGGGNKMVREWREVKSLDIKNVGYFANVYAILLVVFVTFCIVFQLLDINRD